MIHKAATLQHSALAIVEPDSATWDTFTQHHQDGNLLQSSYWGTLKTQYGWQRRIVAVTGADGLVNGAQILFRKRFGLSIAYVPRGPLLSGIPNADRLLFAALDHQAQSARAIFLRLEPNTLEHAIETDSLQQLLLSQNFQLAEPLQPRSSIHLDLKVDATRLSAAMSKGHRADIRRATREGVTVRVGTSPIDFDAFYSILESTSLRAKFNIHTRSYYDAAWKLFSANNAACLLLAERGGTPLATALIFAWAGVGAYLYSGSTEEGLKSGAQHAIQWQAIQWAQEQGCKLYDFWGIPDPLGQAAMTSSQNEREQLEIAARSDPLYGVYRFKKGFGGQVVRYLPAYDRVYISSLYALWKRRMTG